MLPLKIMITLGFMGFLVSLAVAQQAEPAASDTDKKCTPESLVGRYVIIGGEKEGMKEPDERIKGTTVTFTKETVVVADKDKKEIYSASYKLDATTNPCDITMTSRVESSGGQIARGLIKKEGNDVHLIYALPTGEIPVAFKTKEKQLMFVMKKIE
jgi:uncharacterized protein (TIGR03067 family)